MPTVILPPEIHGFQWKFPPVKIEAENHFCFNVFNRNNALELGIKTVRFTIGHSGDTSGPFPGDGIVSLTSRNQSTSDLSRANYTNGLSEDVIECALVYNGIQNKSYIEYDGVLKTRPSASPGGVYPYEFSFIIELEWIVTNLFNYDAAVSIDGQIIA